MCRTVSGRKRERMKILKLIPIKKNVFYKWTLNC